MKLSKLLIPFALMLALASCNSDGGGTQEHQHIFEDHPAVAATCEEDGNIAYAECTECHKIFSSDHKTEIESYVVNKKGHNLTHHFQGCENIEYWECSNCHKNYLDANASQPATDISRNGHVFTDYPAKEATCLARGNIAYARCQNCGKLYAADHVTPITTYIIPKLEHQMTHHEAVIFETIEYWSCSLCHKNYLDEYGYDEAEDISIVGETFSLWNQNVINYLSASTETEIIKALQGSQSPYNDQVRKTVSWKASTGPYTIDFSTDRNFGTYKTYTSTSATFTFPGTLFPGTKYYYRVKDAADKLVVELDGFETDNSFTVRTINMDGVSNVRDIGGWTAKDGNKVQYEMIYRGGRLPNITPKGKEVFFDELGIKTDLDLRTDGTKQLDDDRLNYIKSGMNQYTMLVPGYVTPEIEGKPGTRYSYDSNTPAALKTTFEALADTNNYPIYYHCNAGADRTGSLTYLVNGLLGVSYEDLVKDFELTTFSLQGNRFRSKISNGHFVTEGEYAGIGQCNTDNYVAFGKLHELISTNYAQSNGELYSAIECYLTKVCGISRETITAVRRNLLGKDVEFDELDDDTPVELETVFNPSNGNWVINSQLQYTSGTYFGKEAYKFETTAFTDDHYIENNLALINDEQYTKFHFEVYVPSTSAKWRTNLGEDNGCRFHMSIKPAEGSTNNVPFGESEGGIGHLELDTWQEFDIDISSYTDLKRFAFYLPYGTAEIPGIIYLRDVYVEHEEPETTFTPTNGNWTINSQLQYTSGTYFGKEAYKFETIAFDNDHYIENNLNMITDPQYTKFHFEVYVPSTSAKWRTNLGEDAGPRFQMSIKPMSGSTSYIPYGESESGQGHLELDTWQEFEIDISSYTELKRFAFYIPYGTSETPAIIYLRNAYVD